MLQFHYRPCVTPYTPPTWADGTDAEIAEAVAKADAGEVNLTDYWSIGDERTVSLAAMAASGSNTYGSWSVGETHAAQNVTLVLMNEGYPVNGVDNSYIHFVVGLKDCLNENGVMSYYTPKWENCARREWCNSIFYTSFPNTLNPIFKLFNTKTASTAGNNSASIDTTEDRFALFADKEIFGSRTYCADTEAAQLNQISYYSTSSNRIKKAKSSDCFWWERSPASDHSSCFCYVDSNGNGSSVNGATTNLSLAPFGCI